MEEETFGNVINDTEKAIRPFGFELKKAEEKSVECDNNIRKILVMTFFHEEKSPAENELIGALSELISRKFSIYKIYKHPNSSLFETYADYYGKGLVVTVVRG
jgi:hypothetical protein